MTVDRFYIYRSGKTKACALTREKDDPRLPPNGWEFWMQSRSHQSEDGRYGFDWVEAVNETPSRALPGAVALLVPATTGIPECLHKRGGGGPLRACDQRP